MRYERDDPSTVGGQRAGGRPRKVPASAGPGSSRVERVSLEIAGRREKNKRPGEATLPRGASSDSAITPWPQPPGVSFGSSQRVLHLVQKRAALGQALIRQSLFTRWPVSEFPGSGLGLRGSLA
jgi:hypothetical protein